MGKSALILALRHPLNLPLPLDKGPLKKKKEFFSGAL
jgi:hypothetical protein